MKLRLLFVSTLTLVLAVHLCFAGAGENWAGQYADKKFLGGRAVFQLSIEQSGSAMQVSFDAVYNDGHGAAPEGQGPAKIPGNTLQFKFEDTFKNSGAGTITRAGNDIIVSMKPMHVADPRCLGFYEQNMCLKQVGKK